MTKKIIFISCFVFLVGKIFAQDGEVLISGPSFNLDDDKKLILINQSVTTINAQNPGSKLTISSGEQKFFFQQSVDNFVVGTSYLVTGIKNDLYQLYFTNLPVVHIRSAQTIVDEPRVYARFTLCESNGAFLESPIGVEYRGGFTQSLPKKSLRIEFWKDILGNDKIDYELLGMRKDDDWNLQAMYNEPLRLRSKINFELWQKMDTLYYQEFEPKAINGVRQEYIELFLNGAYLGLYALSERIDRKQLKLNKPQNGQTTGELYKAIDWEATDFYSLPGYRNNSRFWGSFRHEYPSDKMDWSNLFDFVDFSLYERPTYFCEDYSQYIKTDNAVNYFIFINLLRALDNTGKNTYLAKFDLDDPYFFVPWDLDATFGMFWDGEKDDYVRDILSNGLFDKLQYDCSENGFLDKLEKRWILLRGQAITTERILAAYRASFDQLKLNGVYEREMLAWPEYQFPDESGLDYLEQWLDRRLKYLDERFYNTEVLCEEKPAFEPEQAEEITIYPNPARYRVRFFNPNTDCAIQKVTFKNTAGQYLRELKLSPEDNKLDISFFPPGIYFLDFEFCDGQNRVARFLVE